MDRYGGTLKNKARFVLEVVKIVRANFPTEKPNFLRVSALDLKDEVEGLRHKKIFTAPGYQVPFAQQIKRAVPGLAVVAVRTILDGPQVEEVLKNEKTEFLLSTFV
ncbi:hypothetical protein BGZ90_012632 [Linnemannia elongata]|nr:hypothetical protein BGZ90_012632 [Linnemannia elongata]